MSVILERGIKLIPSGGDNIIKTGLTSTSKRLSGYVDATSVPYVTSFTFINQDIDRLLGVETLNDIVELSINGNRYLAFNPVDFALDKKPIKTLNISDTLCYGFMSFLSTYSGIEYFYANNTELSGSIKIPSSVKLAEILGYSNNSKLSGELAPLNDNSNLVYFNCSNNRLQKTIDIGKLPNAIHLDFSKNKFTRVLLNTLTVQTSNVRVFNLADNTIGTSNIDGLTDIYNVLKFFEKLKRVYRKGKSPETNYDYVLNLSGGFMPGIPNRPYEYGYVNMLMEELVQSLTAEPYSWKVHMGSMPIRELGPSIQRARLEAFADPEVRAYIRNWEETNNEVIPTRDFSLVDQKVKKLKSITPPVSTGMMETVNPVLTSSNRVILSAIPVSPTVTNYKWYIGSFWDYAKLNFEPDADHTEYLDEFKTSFLQSKGTSLIYYLETLWFIKTMKTLNLWDSIILWPLKYFQYANKSTRRDESLILIDSWGGGQVNPEFSNTGVKRHTLSLWYPQNPNANQGPDPLNPVNAIIGTLGPALSGVNGIPFSFGDRSYGDSRGGYIPLNNNMTPAMWVTHGFTGIAGLIMRTSPKGFDGGSRSFFGSRGAEQFTQLMNWDVNEFWGGFYKPSAWWDHTGSEVNNIFYHQGNLYRDFRTPTGWPAYPSGFRSDVVGTQNAPGMSFESRANGIIEREENNLLVNTSTQKVNTDFGFTRPYYERDGDANWNGLLYTNWRDLKVQYKSGSYLNFKNNDNLIFKFWNKNEPTTNTPSLSLTYRYKCWQMYLSGYDTSTKTMWFDVGNRATFGQTGFITWLNSYSPGTHLHGRFAHLNFNTKIRVSDPSGESYTYKEATVNTLPGLDRGTGKYSQLQYDSGVPHRPLANSGIYKAEIGVSLRDGEVVFPEGSCYFGDSLGFMPGVTGVRMLSGGKNYTNGIYTNIPLQYNSTVATRTTAFPVFRFQGKDTQNYLLSTTFVTPVPNITNLQWYYYGNMDLRVRVLSNSPIAFNQRLTPATSAAFLTEVMLLPDPELFITYPSSNTVIIYFFNYQMQSRPLFWDSTDTYALWYLTAHNCFVISNTADANIPHSLSSNINCFCNPTRDDIIGGYGFHGTNSWSGTAFNTFNNHVIPGQIKFRDPAATEITVTGTGTYSTNLCANSVVPFTFDKIVVPADLAAGGIFNPTSNNAEFLRYSKTPTVSAKGTVYVVDNQVIAVSATAPGRRITADQTFTLDSLDVGGTGEGATFRVNGTGTLQQLKNSVTLTNPVGLCYFWAPHIVNNSLALEDHLGDGVDWNPNVRGNLFWGVGEPLTTTLALQTNTINWQRLALDYHDTAFISNHFVFNNTTSLLTQITSIYVCARWLSADLGNDLNNARTKRADDRPLIDNFKQQNVNSNIPSFALGTLAIENSATGDRIEFDIKDIVPEMKYRRITTRGFYYVINADRQLQFRILPSDTEFILHAGITSDSYGMLGINKAPGDPFTEQPSLNFYKYPGSTFEAVSRDPWPTVYVPRKPGNWISGPQFDSGPTSRTNIFERGWEGYWTFMMYLSTGFLDLCANRWVKGNTLHTAVTSFFFETSGLDLTLDIK